MTAAPDGLASAVWTEVAAGGTLVVPLGATEQHGPHLPLGTDTLIATAVAAALVERVPDADLAPAIAIGASGEHTGFAGTLSIGTDALALLDAGLEVVAVEADPETASAARAAATMTAVAPTLEEMSQVSLSLRRELILRKSIYQPCGVRRGVGHATAR